MPGGHDRAANAVWNKDNDGRLDIDLTLCALFAAYAVCLQKYFCRLGTGNERLHPVAMCHTPAGAGVRGTRNHGQGEVTGLPLYGTGRSRTAMLITEHFLYEAAIPSFVIGHAKPSAAACCYRFCSALLKICSWPVGDLF